MSKKHSKQLSLLLENASTPEVRQAIERAIEYSERTREEFYSRLRKASELGIDERGVLAGPVRRTNVTNKSGDQRQRDRVIRDKTSED